MIVDKGSEVHNTLNYISMGKSLLEHTESLLFQVSDFHTGLMIIKVLDKLHYKHRYTYIIFFHL